MFFVPATHLARYGAGETVDYRLLIPLAALSMVLALSSYAKPPGPTVPDTVRQTELGLPQTAVLDLAPAGTHTHHVDAITMPMFAGPFLRAGRPGEPVVAVLPRPHVPAFRRQPAAILGDSPNLDLDGRLVPLGQGLEGSWLSRSRALFRFVPRARSSGVKHAPLFYQEKRLARPSMQRLKPARRQRHQVSPRRAFNDWIARLNAAWQN